MLSFAAAPTLESGIGDTTLSNSASAQLQRPHEERAVVHPQVDRAFIGRLVREFYGRVRQDEQLWPIFAAEIAGSWEPHLEKITDFWCSVILKDGSYSGRPIAAHTKLDHVREGDFDVWLGHFRATAEELCPEGVAPAFIDRAERIATSLRLAMFFRLERPSGTGR
jgi:hemoglobin